MTDPDVLTRAGWLDPESAGDRVVVTDEALRVRLSGRSRTIPTAAVSDAVVWRATDGQRRVRLVDTDGSAVLTLSDAGWVTASGRIADVLANHQVSVRTVDAEEGRATGVKDDAPEAQELEALAGGSGSHWGAVAVVAAVAAWLGVAVAGVTDSRTAYERWVDLAALLCVVQLGALVLSRRRVSSGMRHLAGLPLLGQVQLATGAADVRADDEVLAVLAGERGALLPRRGAAAVTGVAVEGAHLLLCGAAGVPLARLQCASGEEAAAAVAPLAAAGIHQLPTASRGGADLTDPRPPRPRGAWLLPAITAFPCVLVAVAGLVFDGQVDPTPLPVAVGVVGAVAILADGIGRALRPPRHGWGETTGAGAYAFLGPVVLVLYTFVLVTPLREHLPREALLGYAVAVTVLGVASLALQAILLVRVPAMASASSFLAFPVLTTALGAGFLAAGRGGPAALAAVLAAPLAIGLAVLGRARA